MRKAVKQFSLVEMLVMSALLLVIFSLLMPNLKKMSRVARETDCSVGIRNLITSTQVYSDDFDGEFPDLQRHPQNGGVMRVAFFAYRYWADFLEQSYGVSRESWYSPSNPHWSFDMFYQYNHGVHMVMGRSYFGAKSMRQTFEHRILSEHKGAPTFAVHNYDQPSQTVLWTDINRKLSGTDLFINPIPGGIKNGSNHLYDLNSNWPELSHNGMIDGSVKTAFSEEIEVRFKPFGSVLHW